MALRNKIDSNETSLFYAREERLGVLPVNPVWTPLEPNEYSDFGGELTLLARNPINSSRQRKKGVITDLDATGGFQQDFTQTNFQDILQGVMFAAFRNKVTTPATAVTATGYTVADYDDWEAGMLAFASGFNDPANNGLKSVSGVSTGEVSVDYTVIEAVSPANAKLTLVGVIGEVGDISIDVSGTYPTITSAAVYDFEALGIIAGEWIYVGGDTEKTQFATPENNGFKRVKSVASGVITIDSSVSLMTAETPATATIQLFFGRVLKNELGPLIKRQSYQLERQMGSPDDASANIQAEYIRGAVPNEFTLNVAQADKITADVAMIAIDNEQRTAAQNVKSGVRVPLIESDAFNTSSDFASLRLSIRQPGVYAPEPLFAYLTEMTVTINNNVSPNKAVAVLGAFDVTAGTFEVSAEATAYFTTIEAVRAVRNNADCGMYAAVAKANAGFVFDLPLIGLGDARADVTQDEPITLPIAMDAATAAKIDPNTDFTIMWVFFDYLPTSANPNN